MQMNKRKFQRRTLKETVLYRVLPHDMKWASKTERLTRATEQFLALFLRAQTKRVIGSTVKEVVLERTKQFLAYI